MPAWTNVANAPDILPANAGPTGVAALRLGLRCAPLPWGRIHSRKASTSTAFAQPEILYSRINPVPRVKDLITPRHQP
jgi:hypothetical protein